jgi:hypothetical protein
MGDTTPRTSDLVASFELRRSECFRPNTSLTAYELASDTALAPSSDAFSSAIAKTAPAGPPTRALKALATAPELMKCPLCGVCANAPAQVQVSAVAAIAGELPERHRERQRVVRQDRLARNLLDGRADEVRARSFELDAVAQAHREGQTGHVTGKLVLVSHAV